MTVSPKRQMRQSKGRKRTLKERFIRQLRVENLERRELMASDFAPFHNYQMPNDVDGDFRVSPLDALVVINQLNAVGSGSLQDRNPPQGRSGLVDTNRDNALGPLDALAVINSLNRGEGEDIRAAVRYQFFLLNADGTIGRNLDPNPNDLFSEAVVNKGEKFVVRTQMRDVRFDPKGVFSAVHDLNFINADGSTREKMELQWSDYNAFKIGLQDLDPNPDRTTLPTLQGSFKLQYGFDSGPERTGAIQIANFPPPPNAQVGPVNRLQTAANIQAALEALPSIGRGNVTVSVNITDPDPGHNFDIFFRNRLARTNMPAPTIEDANFIVSVGPATPTISDISNPDPSNPLATRSALSFEFSPQFPEYFNGPSGFLSDLSNTPGGRSVSFLGGFSNSLGIIPQPEAFEFFNIVDTTFVAAVAGTLNLNGSVSPIPTGATGRNLGIALYEDGDQYLTDNQVAFESAVIRIIERLTATDDVYTQGQVREDIAATLNVGVNDSERDGLDFGIVDVSQPTNGAGTVTFVNNGTAKSVLFTPAKDYFGPTTFTYIIRSSRGDTSEATVTLDVVPVNDPPVEKTLAYSIGEDDPLSPLVIAPTDVFSVGPANESNQTMLPLTIVTGPTAAQGTASINQTTGNLEFTPAADFFGTVNITVRGTDSGPNTPAPNVNNTQTILTITVTPVNDAPRIVGSTFSVSEDPTPPVLSITPAQLFTPGPANESSQTVTLSIPANQPPIPGTASIAPNGSLVFDPNENFFGQVTLTVVGTDNGTPNQSTSSLITINVTPVNDAPIAVNDAFNVIALGDPNTLNVLSNDLPGPGGEPGSISVVSVTGVTPSTSGTVQVAPGGSSVVFTPSTSPSVFGTTATFNYTINDQAGLPATATVTVTILPPASPFAVDDDYRSNTTLRINEDTSATFDVLANDFSRGTKSLAAGTSPSQPRIISGPGSVSIEGNLIRYTPEADRSGEVVFTYAMDDTDTLVEPNERRVATVTVLVEAVNDAPIAVDRTLSTAEDVNLEVRIADLSLSSGPLENDSLVLISPTLTDSTKGSITFTPGSTSFTYVPNKDFFGEALVTYSVRDNGTPALTSSVATITINVTSVNDNPITSPKTLFATENMDLPISIDDVIKDDVAGPANEIQQGQTVSFVNFDDGQITTARGGTITQIITQNGLQLLYDPPANFNGTDTFTYTVTDGQSENATSQGVVTIVVSEVNDAPVANNIRKTVFAGVNTVIDVSAELAAMSRGSDNAASQILEASQTLVMSQKLTDPNLGEIRSFGATQLTYFAPLGTQGETTFRFEVIDNGTTGGEPDARTSVATFTIVILPFIPSSLKGFVFIDDNANGILDRSPTNNEPLELAIGGVEVTLTYADEANPGRTISVTEMTEADGSYDFELLPPGVYTVRYSTPLLMTNSQNAIMSYTRTILAPGDDNFRFDFPVLGIVPEYGSHLEYLASSFYTRDGSLRSRGMYAAINANGTTDWTSRKDGYDSGVFHELVLSNDGTKAYLSEVKADGKLYTATLNERRQFIRMRLDDGRQLVRVLASASELNWVEVNPATPPITARGYLETVDDFFEQEGWMWP